MTMGVGAFESPDLGEPSRYLRPILLSSTNFLGALKTKSSVKRSKIPSQGSKFRDKFLKNSFT